MSDRREAGVDLTNCDREPIHIPGSIQPHGVLLALGEPGLDILQASMNASDVLGENASLLVGMPLSDVLDAEAFASVRRATSHETFVEVNPIVMRLRGHPYDGVLHRYQGVLVLELEPKRGGEADRTHHPLRHVVASLQAARTLPQLLTAGVDAVKRLTGFERVMVYSFDEEGHGSVDAEARDEDLEPYLGLRYPASDIPRQARDLYLRNTIRSIPDARYVSVPLVPAVRPDSGAPLDLSFAVLRSVSPIHLEYMANMGVRASMSISLVVRDRLWGLISCAHHSGPHHLAYARRTDCEIVGRMMSLLIGAFADRDTAAGRQRRRPLLDVFADAARSADDVLATLIAQPQAPFALLGIDGAAVVAGDVSSVGRVPPADVTRALADWLQVAAPTGVFTTDALTQIAPAFAAVKGVASGVVSFVLPGAVPRRFIGFRPEILQTVTWGGDPRKPVEQDGGATLHPRRSFARWREELHLRSLPWTPSDREAAEELRRVVVEIDLARQVELEQRSVKARDDLVAVVSHDLRNPLNVIRMQAVLLRHLAGGGIDEPGSRLRASLDRIQRSVSHMDVLIHDLLDCAHIEAGRFAVNPQPESLEEMVAEAMIILRPLAEAKGLAIEERVDASLMVLADRERVFQVMSNLVGNAIKFTPGSGRVAVRATTEPGQAVIAVSDTGPGLTPEQLPHVFNRYWQASRTTREGTGLGLYIARGIVEAHDGRIWVETRPEGGATFTFTLPLAPSM